MAKSASVAISPAGRHDAIGARTGTGLLRIAVAAAILVLIVVQAGLVAIGNAPVLDGILADPDAYMRLSRVRLLWATGGWYDPIFPRIGPPQGFELHWTRPLDALLLCGAWLASPLLGFDRALYWWGVLIGPVLHIIAVVAFVWAAAPVLPHPRWRAWVAFLFVSQPAIFISFLIGRPDHHGLVALLAILIIGFTVRLLLEPGRARDCVWLGLAAAGAIWVSIEALLPVTVSIGALGLSWVLGDRRCAQALALTAATVLGALALALLVERGPEGLTAFAIDRLSGAHLILFTINLAFWTTVQHYERRNRLSGGPVRRVGWLLLGLAAALATVAVLVPGFFAHPLTSGDAIYVARHLAHVEELQPLFGPAEPGQDGWSPARPTLWLGIAILAGPWLARCIARAQGPERRVWIYLGLGALVTLPIAAAQRRWSFYPELFLLMPYAALAGTVVDWLSARLPRLAAALARLTVICGLCTWVYLPAAFSGSQASLSMPAGSAAVCPVDALAPILNDPAGLGTSPKRVLAFIDVGPELLYRTGHSVFSIPSHRFQPGFTTTYRIMTATDPSRARRLLAAARVDLVLICPESAEAWFYDTAAGAPTFHELLSDGRAPEFLEPVPLPEAVAGRIKLYRVRSPE